MTAPMTTDSNAARQAPADDAELDRMLDALGAADPDLARARAASGALPDRTRPATLASLTKIVVQQQVSLASADAIWGRFEAAVLQGGAPFTADAVLALGEAEMRAAGLSRPKAAYCRNLAAAVADGDLDLAGLARLDDEAALEALTRIKGIGRWTAEIFMMFAHGRVDLWPAHDVALQVAVQQLKALEERPSWRRMDTIAEPWRPWRGVAARLLWRYYRVIKDRPDPTG